MVNHDLGVAAARKNRNQCEESKLVSDHHKTPLSGNQSIHFMHDGTIDDAIAHPPTPIFKTLPPALAILNMEGLAPIVVTKDVNTVAIQSSGWLVRITPHQI